MLNKVILSLISVVSLSVLTAGCSNDSGNSNNNDSGSSTPAAITHQLVEVSVSGTVSEVSTAIANGETDSDESATDFEILLPLDNATLSADPGDGSEISDIINLQVTGNMSNATTVNIGLIINPLFP